jgi:hypothetical protein
MTLDPAALCGSWLRSSEEDTATEVVYRPVSYRFPPSRGRDGLKLSADGTALFAGTGPTDLARHQTGRWRLEQTRLHLEFDDPAAAPRVLELVDVTPDRLVAKR